MARIACASRRTGRAVGVAMLVLAAAAPAAQASFPGRNGRIAVGYQKCDAELAILTMRSDGTKRRVLTRPTCDEKEGGNAPDWSPDGRRLVYLTDEGEVGWGTGSRLALMNRRGSDRTILPIAPVYDGFFGRTWYDDSPSFAPDGERIAYVHLTERPNGDDPASDIWISRVDGTDARRLRAGRRPHWSPDGRSIAYVTRPGQLRLMDAEDGALMRVLARRDVSAVDWAPNGRRLVYSQGVSGVHSGGDVFIVKRDGTGARRLIEMPHGPEWTDWWAEDVRWSPDGRRLAVVRGRTSYGEATRYSLFVTNARGQNAKTIYRTEVGIEGESLPDYGPTIAWQPLPR